MTGAQYRIPPDVHSRRFDAELVILDLARGTYFALEGAAVEMWELLAAGRTTNEVVEVLGPAFDVDTTKLREDLDRMTSELCHLGLLQQVEVGHDR
jgi:hypothetical protein